MAKIRCATAELRASYPAGHVKVPLPGVGPSADTASSAISNFNGTGEHVFFFFGRPCLVLMRLQPVRVPSARHQMRTSSRPDETPALPSSSPSSDMIPRVGCLLFDVWSRRIHPAGIIFSLLGRRMSRGRCRRWWTGQSGMAVGVHGRINVRLPQLVKAARSLFHLGLILEDFAKGKK